jgi:N-acetylglucosamine malate deacetylase 2
MNLLKLKLFAFNCFLMLTVAGISHAQTGPKILVVNAHPDDETSFPIILYKITHDLKGTVDLVVMTDGGGGYHGSELGSVYYGLKLTDSLVGRENLPRIRKKEVMQAGDIMGIRNYFFFDQQDDYYNLNPIPYITGKNWDVAFIEKKLDNILATGQYDYIITMLPYAGQHAHHKTAVILALRALQRFKGEKKPIIIAGSTYTIEDPAAFTILEGFPETAIKKNVPSFYIDVASHFGYKKQVSYKIIAQWVIACYKSQGDMQENPAYKGDKETFRLFDINDDAALKKTGQLFDQLTKSGYSADQK